jgi:hypothetical protein
MSNLKNPLIIVDLDKIDFKQGEILVFLHE